VKFNCVTKNGGLHPPVCHVPPVLDRGSQIDPGCRQHDDSQCVAGKIIRLFSPKIPLKFKSGGPNRLWHVDCLSFNSVLDYKPTRSLDKDVDGLEFSSGSYHVNRSSSGYLLRRFADCWSLVLVRRLRSRTTDSLKQQVPRPVEILSFLFSQADKRF
jgi:hypothetical protein